MKKALVGATALALALPGARAADPPTIVQIRANYNAVNAQIEQGRYRAQRKEVRLCGDSVVSYTRWLDGRGVVRRLTAEQIDDAMNASTNTLTSLWFSASGRLGFVLYQSSDETYDVYTDAQGRIVNNGMTGRHETAELRVYFDSAGRVVRTLSKYAMPNNELAAHIADFKKMAAQPWGSLTGGCE